MKHNITMLCAALTALTMLQPAVCTAEETTTQTYRNFKYEERGDHIALTGFLPTRNEEVIVPRTIEGLPVTEAPEALFPLKSGQTRYVVWADTIPVIPAHAFSGNTLLRAIVIPETVTEIGDDILGGKTEVDIFYKGTAAQWDAIKIGKGNGALTKCNVHCDWCDESDLSYTFGKNDWSFTSDDVGRYQLTEDGLQRYLGDLTEKDKQTMRDTLTGVSDASYLGIGNGMGVSMYLNACGVLDPSDIAPDAKLLPQIPLGDAARDALFLYDRSAKLARTAAEADPENSAFKYTSENIRDYLEAFRPGVLFTAILDGEKMIDHALVAYDVQSGAWEFNGKSYTDRILVADPNEKYSPETVSIYVAADGMMYDPTYPEMTEFPGFTLVPRTDIYLFTVGGRTVYAPTYDLGDLDQDSEANAADASAILGISTAQGAGQSVDMTIGELYAADVDGDGDIDAADASEILTYAAEKAVGHFEGTLAAYVSAQE